MYSVAGSFVERELVLYKQEPLKFLRNLAKNGFRVQGIAQSSVHVYLISCRKIRISPELGSKHF